MEEKKQNPSTNLVVSTNNVVVNQKSEEDLLAEEISKDFNDSLVQAAMDNPALKPIIEKAKIAIRPMLMAMAQKLGNDDVRYMLWRDPETKSLILETVKMDNIKEFKYHNDPTIDDLIIIPENPDNVDELIQEIIKKVMSNVKII